jgi:NDP-sugar pyrophosphorylase family protein
MTVFRNDNRWDSSNVIFSGRRVELYSKDRSHPRVAEMRFIDYGLSVLTRDLVLSCIVPGAKSDVAELFHSLSVQGQLAGCEVHERFYEVGSPEGLKELTEYLLNHKQAAGLPERAPEPYSRKVSHASGPAEAI